MDQKTVAFARSWARRYVRTKHPHGLDEGDVQNRILESLYYNKDKKKALSEALNSVQNESRRNLRALRPWQVRNAEPHLEAQAYRNLARDMRRLRIRQSVRENRRSGDTRGIAGVVIQTAERESSKLPNGNRPNCRMKIVQTAERKSSKLPNGHCAVRHDMV